MIEFATSRLPDHIAVMTNAKRTASPVYLLGSLLLPALLGLTGCGRDDVRVYSVPKEQAKPAAHGATAHAQPQGSIGWVLPAGWIDKGASRIRVGNFALTNSAGLSADVSVIPLSSWAGLELENVNRWRGQIGLPAIQAAELPQHTVPVEIAGSPGQLYEMGGAPGGSGQPKRILAAVLSLPGLAWFFKMTGDNALVMEQKGAFLDFLKSVNFAAADPSLSSGQPALPADHPSLPPNHPPLPADHPTLPPDHPPIQSAAPPADGLDKPPASKPAWAVPAGWSEQTPASVQLARYTADAPGGAKAEITVTVLSGDGGGLLANVNRWRGQLGLEPLDQAGLDKLAVRLDLDPASGSLVDMTAANKEKRMVAVTTVRGPQSWFYRLSGNEAAVTAHKEAFIKFVQSAK